MESFISFGNQNSKRSTIITKHSSNTFLHNESIKENGSCKALNASNSSSPETITMFKFRRREKVACLIGAPNVGKTNLIMKMLYNTFHYKITSNQEQDYYMKNVVYKNEMIQLILIDSSNFLNEIAKLDDLSKDSDVLVYVFDWSNPESFMNVKYNAYKYQLYYKKSILIGNKIDIANSFCTEYMKKIEEFKIFCDKFGMTYMDTSALTNYNIPNLKEFILE